MQVSKSSAFTDSLKQAEILGVMDQIAGGVVVFPRFSRRSSSEDDSPKDPSSPSSNPRQLFFERAGQQMVQDEGIFQTHPMYVPTRSPHDAALLKSLVLAQIP